jgi:arginine/lysine/ornithine decarboxylase
VKYDIYLPISKEDVIEGLKQHPDAEAVYLTSPTFEGLLCNYKEIREAIGPDRYLIIDEAHGSHLYFNTEDSDTLRGALQSGAVDVCVTSVHKNLGSLSATAFINVGVNSRLSAE